MSILLRAVLFAGLSLAGVFAARALDAPLEFTLDLPFGPNQATPSWLGQPSTPAGTFATLDLPVTPPDGSASLLITVFYAEKAGGFLRISWAAGGVPPVTSGDDLPGPGEVGASSILCDNFYEGIGMSNQRSLLVPADTLRQGGLLRFQTGDSALGISRLKLEWLGTSTGLTSPAITDVLVTSSDGKTRLSADLAGMPPQAADPSWKDQIVNVPITDVPVRVEQGVDFTVHTAGAPALARLALKETGLPWGQHLVVWINNARAGVIHPATPALDDPGYADGAAPYVGWREGTLFVPAGSLAAGDNVLQFSTEPDAPSDVADSSPAAPVLPLALKEVSLQLDYPASALATAAASPAIPPTKVLDFTTTP